MDKYNELSIKNKSESDRYDEIWKSMQDINKALVDINHNDELIKSYITSLTGLERDRSTIEHTLANLKEYKIELQAYTEKYDKIEIVKRYSSPLKGIQNIFMEVYMNKIIDLANQMLVYLFEGEYVLQPFIITADEFRIPCKGSGYINDDISSMSTAQICMISMIVSFSLLYQSSSKYNILHLDEIDGGLDTRNRLQFTHLLHQLIDLLECEQCIMVSHNNELNTEEADIIMLKNPGEQVVGNIIWSLE
jgi:DNA repair exonuclease SbcCD ATPase subunit